MGPLPDPQTVKKHRKDQKGSKIRKRFVCQWECHLVGVHGVEGVETQQKILKSKIIIDTGPTPYKLSQGLGRAPSNTTTSWFKLFINEEILQEGSWGGPEERSPLEYPLKYSND